MGRVGDDHVGGRDLGHHPAPRHLALGGANLGLDFGIALGLLGFLAQLFARHLELLGVLPELVRHVDCGDCHQRADDQHEALQQQVTQVGAADIERLQRQRHDFLLLAAHHHPCNIADQPGLAQRLAQLHQRIGRHHPGQTAHRVELAEAGHEGLGAEVPAAYKQGRAHRHQHQQSADGRERQQHVDQQRGRTRDQQVHVIGLLALEHQAVAEQAAELCDQPAAEHPEGAAGSEQHAAGGQLARTRHVALLARIVQAFL